MKFTWPKTNSVPRTYCLGDLKPGAKFRLVKDQSKDYIVTNIECDDGKTMCVDLSSGQAILLCNSEKIIRTFMTN